MTSPDGTEEAEEGEEAEEEAEAGEEKAVIGRPKKTDQDSPASTAEEKDTRPPPARVRRSPEETSAKTRRTTEPYGRPLQQRTTQMTPGSLLSRKHRKPTSTRKKPPRRLKQRCRQAKKTTRARRQSRSTIRDVRAI